MRAGATVTARERAAAQWPTGEDWREHDRGCVFECWCGQPCRATDGYLHACSEPCAADAEARMRARIAPYLSAAEQGERDALRDEIAEARESLREVEIAEAVLLARRTELEQRIARAERELGR